MFDSPLPQDVEAQEELSPNALAMLDRAIRLVSHASSECFEIEFETTDGTDQSFLVACLLEIALRNLQDEHPQPPSQGRSTQELGEEIYLDRAISLLEQASRQALHPPIASDGDTQKFWAIHCVIEGALTEVRDVRSELGPNLLVTKATSNLQEVSHV